MDFEKQKQLTVLRDLEGFNVDVVIENAKKKETAEDFLNIFLDRQFMY
ncbi:hypothetical protein MKX31_02980 [Bacillus sp. FSL M8-0063]|nr:hypothetical protein [Bacillus mycoides]